MSGTLFASGAGVITNVTVGGNVSGTIAAPETVSGSTVVGAGSISGLVVGSTLGGGTVSGTISTGTLSTSKITGDVTGTVSASGAGVITNVTVGGNVTGTIAAPEDPKSPTTSGSITGLTVGSSTGGGTVSGTISTGTLSMSTITGNVTGKVSTSGAGVIMGVMIDGSVAAGGSVIAMSDSSMGSGNINGLTVVGGVAGLISAPEYQNTLAGTVNGGSITNLLIGNTAGGTTTSATVSGTISTGTLSQSTITGDVSGTLFASGAGVITNVTVGGNVSGTIAAPETVSGSTVVGAGSISGLVVGSTSGGGTVSGTITTGTLASSTITGNVSGKVSASGAGVITNVSVGGNVSGTISAPEDTSAGSGNVTGLKVGGSLTGTVTTGTVTSATIGGSVGSTGKVVATGAGLITSLTVVGDVQGTIQTFVDFQQTTPGTVQSLSINGNLLSGAVITADAINSLVVTNQINTSLNVQSLGSVSAGSFGSSASISSSAATADPTNAGAFGSFGVGGVQYTLAAIPTLPASSHESLAGVTFGYSISPSGSFQNLTILVNNPSPTSTPFDLNVIASAPGGALQLQSLGSSPSGSANATGIQNVIFDGSLAPAAGKPAIYLPGDNLNSVAVLGNVPAGSIWGKSIMVVSFGSESTGSSVTSAANASPSTAQATLYTGTKTIPGTKLAQANGYLESTMSSAGVVQFTVIGSPLVFSAQTILFTDNTSTNVADVVETWVAPTKPGSSQLLGLAFAGVGGSVSTGLLITTAITAAAPIGNGPPSSIGNIVLTNSAGLIASVSAPSITGNIIAQSGPITGSITSTMGDIGSAANPVQIKGISISGTISSAGNLFASIASTKGNFTGSVLSGGNFVGSINSTGSIGVVITASPGNTAPTLIEASSINATITSVGNIYSSIVATNGALMGSIKSGGALGEVLSSTTLGPYLSVIMAQANIGASISSTGTIASSIVSTNGDIIGGISTTSGDIGLLYSSNGNKYASQITAQGISGNITSDGNLYSSINALSSLPAPSGGISGGISAAKTLYSVIASAGDIGLLGVASQISASSISASISAVGNIYDSIIATSGTLGGSISAGGTLGQVLMGSSVSYLTDIWAKSNISASITAGTLYSSVVSFAGNLTGAITSNVGDIGVMPTGPNPLVTFISAANISGNITSAGNIYSNIIATIGSISNGSKPVNIWANAGSIGATPSTSFLSLIESKTGINANIQSMGGSILSSILTTGSLLGYVTAISGNIGASNGLSEVQGASISDVITASGTTANTGYIYDTIDAYAGSLAGTIKAAKDIGVVLTNSNGGFFTTSICASSTATNAISATITSGGTLISSINTLGGISGAISSSGDIGVSYSQIQAPRGLSGSITAGGNLLSSIYLTGISYGTILAQGNIGSTNGTTLTGSIFSSTDFDGQIVALGNIYESVTINGTLNGQIAAANLVGNVTITKIGSSSTGNDTGSIVSAGEIGDMTFGTTLQVKSNSGIIAALGMIYPFNKTQPPGTGFYQTMATMSSGNAIIIDMIFAPGWSNVSTELDLLEDLIIVKPGVLGETKD